MPVALSAWRAVDPSACLCHLFPEGVAVFRTSDKSSFYLPHPAGAVFATLCEQSCDMSAAAIQMALESDLDSPALEAVLAELEQLRLVARCP